MDFVSVIAARRDGRKHTREELRALARGAADGSIPDYQLSAWLMAAYLSPLSIEETAWLTLEMADSGERLDLTGLPKPWLDKHSTGGVGDKLTIALLPLLAACGLTMVKMSGRGLGITGGTIDKLSSIPGFRLDLSPDEMKAQAGRIGLALTGQTPRLAPADGVLYALRDVTATVANIPLIVSSILSKKIAGGADTIVLDVKCGSGAFMSTPEEAEVLRRALVDVGNTCGVKVEAEVTDMDQPLGEAVGNAIEVDEAFDVLRGRSESANALRFRDFCLEMAAHSLDAVGVADSDAVALEALESGSAWEKASAWVEAQGGVVRERYAEDRPIAVVRAERSGVLAKLDARLVGESVVRLGGGRKTKSDQLDLHVGVRVPQPVGRHVEAGQVVFEVLGRTLEEAEAEARALQAAVSIRR